VDEDDLDWDEVSPEDYVFAHWVQKESPEAPRTDAPQDAFLVRWNALLELSPRQRILELAKSRGQFEEQRRSETDLKVKAQMVVGITEMAFLVNRATMGTNKGEPGAEDQALVKETHAIIRSVVEMLADSRLAQSLFQVVQLRSNGHTLGHVVRVFATMVDFLVFYNRCHNQGLIQKLRKAFPTKYAQAYRKRLPHLADNWVTSDNLVRLPALSVAKIREYALGALLHDIGKITDLAYFEQGSGYDREKIEQHPILGCGLFLRTYGTSHEEARYIIGDHHNYLFHPDGYGLTRWERKRSQRVLPPPRCVISDTLGAFTDGTAMGFLPAELCSIIDVYDALTDPTRIYKVPLSPAEAVQFIDSDFLAVGKVDPILFSLFQDYLASREAFVPTGS